MTGPDYSFEDAAIVSGARYVAGVDEVGRGPLAGPVTAAAVILEVGCIPEGLNDSKKLTAKRRAVLAEVIMASCDWSVAHATVEEIDELNILRASHLAMCRAIAGLRQRPCVALIDGNMLPDGLDLPGQAIIGGDARSLSISAASIIAKMWRDRIMVDLAQQHPGYGWEANAGYPTPAHRRALLDLGVTPHHRRSFAPVHNILCKGQSASS
ncbi:ribonuclease HII [Paracoccus sp. MBLB3053]|uniref:Ribonuclease HII n=1 Tax=Paracoccus aurantius TaxID=3073814 RepID=A0ABU2HMP1_9RHOB|nr:ribonuclease HII [Paracoccus sp. MBLB3053]MDS9466304.1 ribonuclease HII [Paracoccus sp. MBLB3053]